MTVTRLSARARSAPAPPKDRQRQRRLGDQLLGVESNFQLSDPRLTYAQVGSPALDFGSSAGAGSGAGPGEAKSVKAPPVRSTTPAVAPALTPAPRVVGRVDFVAGDFVALADAVGVARLADESVWLSAAAMPAPASEAHTPTARAPAPSSANERKPRA
jgi:hypothetical protein